MDASWSVTDPAGGETHYGYDAGGNRTSATLPNGTRSAWLYDDRDRVTRAEHRRADGTVLGSYDYTLTPPAGASASPRTAAAR